MENNAPTTPSIVGGQNSLTFDPEPKLTEELIKAGWTVNLSQRLSKWYFYNKFTQQSLWEMPSAQVPNSLTDPLGIGSGAGQTVANDRRRRSSDSSGPLPPKRAFSLRHSWNLELETNVFMWDRPHFELKPPHPDIERMRSDAVKKLRVTYDDLCHSKEGIEAPAESFNRWLLERKLVDEGDDPFLPSKCDNPISPSLKREVMNDIPIALVKPKYTSDVKRQLYRYAEAAKRMVDLRPNASPNCRKLIKWKVDETFTYLRTHQHASFDDYLERLGHLKRFCHKELRVVANDSIDSICRTLYEKSSEAAKEIHEKHMSILKAAGVNPPFTPPVPERKKVYCYPALLSVPCPRMPSIIRNDEEQNVKLTHKGDTRIISLPYFEKLEELYRYNCKDDDKKEHFLARVWCLLRRYSAYYGLGQAEGAGLQGALPVKVFECLHRCFNVTFECFASPLNCFFKQFCSAFADTDGYFGSRGNILDFKPIHGSFEANPPFSEELMVAMIDHFEALLEESSEALSFIVFVPEWRDPPTEALLRMESSKFKRKQMSIPAMQHEYRHGFQHVVPKDEVNKKSAHATLIVFLQNDQGFNTWTPTPEKIKELQTAYIPQDFSDTFGQS